MECLIVGRLGPGRLHHCMRLVGAAERALREMASRASSRVAFGGPLSDQGGVREKLGRCRIDVDAARLVTLAAAAALDEGGFKVKGAVRMGTACAGLCSEGQHHSMRAASR